MSTPASADGRTARRSRNRELVLDAVLDLFTKGNFHPTPEDVAAASGVSLRSVYRYVDSRDDLLQAAMERHLEKTAHMWALDTSSKGPLSDRVERFVEHRLRLHEAVGSSNRAARAFARRDSTVAERLRDARRLLRRQLERQFAPELSALSGSRRRAVVTSLDSLTQLEGLDSMMVQQELSMREARETLTFVITVLLESKE